MTDETLTPIASLPANSRETAIHIGRQADILAALLACLGAIFSVLGAFWFFIGFAENDTRPEHLASALMLTLILFAFAIIPFSLTAGFARHAYRSGTKRAHLLWTLFLMLPWVALGIIAITHAPLPIWYGLSLTSLALLLSLWALVSLVLDRKTHGANTGLSQENEVPVTPK